MRDRSSGFCMPEYMYLYVNIYIYIFFIYQYSLSVNNVGERVMRNNVAVERNAASSFLSPFYFWMCFALLCIQGVPPTAISRNRGISTKSIEISTVSTFIGKFSRDSVVNRISSDQMSLQLASSFLEVRYDKRRTLTLTLEELLLYALAFSFEDWTHLDAVRRELCCVHDWSWIAIDRSMKTRASWLEHLVRLTLSSCLSLVWVYLRGKSDIYTANRVAVTR